MTVDRRWTFALLLCLAGAPARAGSAGDLNGDGDVDVSDAITILDHLYRGGPPPAAIEPLPGLPVTGVKSCYADGARIDCPEPEEPFYGQDGNYRAGRPRDFEVVRPDPADASTWYTVDFATGLVWQYVPDPRRKVWRDALSDARSLRLGGHDDWRLPNISELLSIFNFEPGGPALDPAAFAPGPDDALYTTYWSSTSFPNDSGAGEGLVVDFVRGTVHTSPKDPGYLPAYARAVRSLPPLRHGDLNGDGEVDLSDAVRLLFHLFAGDPSLTLRGPVRGLPATGQVDCYDSAKQVPCELVDGEETHSSYAGQDGHARAGAPRSFELVKPDPGEPSTWYTLDHATGLAWQFSEAPVPMTFAGALAHCEGLELGGFDDWRLPNVRELQSIADYGRRPSLDPAFFGTESLKFEDGDHWVFSSSSPGLSFYMDLGFVAGGYSDTGWVRAVRMAEPPHR